MHVFITGGTGFIGRHIVSQLLSRGDQVSVVTRSPKRAAQDLNEKVQIIEGNPTSSGPWQDALKGADAVINLVGEPIDSKRWNAQFRQKLLDSRVDSTRFIVEALASLDASARPKVFVNASGADYYALRDASDIDRDEPVDESSPSGDSFLARLCERWESEALEGDRLGVRVVVLRTGLVVGRGGGFEKLITQFKLFAGGPIGTGKQWVSWIHVADAAAAYIHALDTEALRGPVNMVAPGNVQNKEFASAIGHAMGRPSWVPVPGFALKLAVGEFSQHILKGRRTVPTALLESGFQFSHPEVEEAMRSLDW